MQVSRRAILTWATTTGIALSVSPLGAAPVSFAERETLPGKGADNPAATATGRIDASAKVTGAKLYASDYRAADMPGWPTTTAHALLLRAPDATHVYLGLDLDRLVGPAKPARVVTSADLSGMGFRVPAFYEGDLFCAPGKTPLYLGQPVALLIFETFESYDQARLIIRRQGVDRGILRFGEETGPVIAPPYASFRFTRVAGPTPDAPDVYSPILAGWVSPGRIQNTELPVWASFAKETSAPYGAAARHGEAIRAGLRADDPDLLVLDRAFETQSVDPMFLEPEAGLAFYDPKAGALEMVIGVQSPYEATDSVGYLLGTARAPFKPKHIQVNCAHMGGGFGGRDHTPFILYTTLAGMFFPGRPVRLAHDRFQQFQAGIKRHAIKFQSRIGVSRTTGKIMAFAADHVLDGGGLANFSPNVATVAAASAIGIYDVPKVDVTTVALKTRGVTAGSMRGYGTLQAMSALEVLVDEVTTELKLDPIAFRRTNALKQGGRTMTGNPYIVSVRTTELLDKVEAHDTWARRAEYKNAAPDGVLIGTGVACVTKDYGTGGDCSLGRVELRLDGTIGIYGDHTEMGNAIGTALANRVAIHLGAIADEVAVAQVGVFGALDLVTSGDSYTMDQPTQDKAAQNPRWVPAISSATSASVGAHVGTHAAAEAARVIYRYGIWPAALGLWKIRSSDPRAKKPADARWKDGRLTLPDLPPLDLPLLARAAHAAGFVTGAIAHGFSRWAWSTAEFPIDGTRHAGEIDALAIRRGNGAFQRLTREKVAFPPTNNNRIGTSFTSACATIVRVEIQKATGALRIAKAYSVFECGQALVPQVVMGQAQGGFAMGVGYALLETLPPYEGGPGDGKWNLGRYLVARGSDLPLRDLEIEMLPPLTSDEPPKGMAEVVMIPVVAALLNAIHDATGHRFRSLPVTQPRLKEVLA